EDGIRDATVTGVQTCALPISGVSIWEEDFSQAKAAIDDLRASGVRDFRAYFAAHSQFVQDAIAMVKIVDINAASLKLFAAENKRSEERRVGKECRLGGARWAE